MKRSMTIHTFTDVDTDGKCFSTVDQLVGAFLAQCDGYVQILPPQITETVLDGIIQTRYSVTITVVKDAESQRQETTHQGSMRNLIYAIEAQVGRAQNSLAPIFKDEILSQVETELADAMDAILDLREMLGGEEAQA